MTVTLSTTEQVVAAVPFQLGFTPAQSVVIVGCGSPSMCARIDLPTTDSDRINATSTLVAAFKRNRIARVIVIGYSDNQAEAAPALRTIAEGLRGVSEVAQVLHVTGEIWQDLETGHGGVVDARTREEFAARFILEGRRAPAASREAMVAALAPVDPAPVETAMQAATVTVQNLTDLTAWVGERVETFLGDQNPPHDHDAAVLLLALANKPARDAALRKITRATAASHVALWTNLTRRSPEGTRPHAATMLAFAAWIAGDGAKAWAALDLVEDHSRYRLAGLVAQALTEAIPPSAWDGFREDNTA